MAARFAAPPAPAATPLLEAEPAARDELLLGVEAAHDGEPVFLHEGDDLGQIEAVPVDQLQAQAFLEVAGKDAGRLEALEHCENRFNVSGCCSQGSGDTEGIADEITGLVDHADQMLADESFSGILEMQMKLVGQVFGKGNVASQTGGKVPLLAVKGKMAGTAHGRPCRVAQEGLPVS